MGHHYKEVSSDTTLECKVTRGLGPHQLLVRIDQGTLNVGLHMTYSLLGFFTLTLNAGELFTAHPVARIQGMWINLVVVTGFHVKRTPLGIVKERYLILFEICSPYVYTQRGLNINFII